MSGFSTAQRHPAFFGQFYKGESWAPWLTVGKILDGRKLNAAEREFYTKITGRTDAPAQGYARDAADTIREVWFVKGRRLGYSRFVSAFGIHRTACSDYSAHLAAGEVGTFALVASDRKQARTIRRYVDGFVDAIPHVRAMVAKRTADAIEFSNQTSIEIHTCSFKSTRGYTLVGAACDEVAFWNTDGWNPDVDILNALRPGMSTIPGALLLCGSSPWARRGALFQAWSEHWAKNDDPVLVIVADTRTLNPAVPQRVIDEALAADEVAARSEYLAQFRRDVAGYASIDQLEPVILVGITSLPPVKGRRYKGHMDAASGSGTDALTGAVAYYDPEIEAGVLAATIEIKPPFSPTSACESVAALFKQYGVTSVTADRWGGDFVTEAMAKLGVRVEACTKTRSDLYAALLPLITAQKVRLLDDRKVLIAQCLGLERRVGRLKDIIDHAPNGHDDLINSAAGALLAAQADWVPLCAPIGPTRLSPWKLYG